MDERGQGSEQQANSVVITFVVPCYNSAAYMEKCLASIVDVVEEGAPSETGEAARWDIEVLVVDDGSTDDGATLGIARTWETQHPGLVRAIHQENGGPGEAINTGLAQARGAYFKVVDSDDWLDADALRKLLAKLRQLCSGSDDNALDKALDNASAKAVDMVVCNYVYEYEDASPARPVRYTREFPQNRPFTWDDMLKPFPMWRYMMMHAAIYRTSVLRTCGLHLPAHTFYVDEIVIYAPLPYVHTLYYLDADLYRYLIGRADQSVNEQIMSSRCDQQVHVARIKIDAVDVASVPSKNLRRYLTADLTITMCFCTVFTTLSDRPDRFELRDGIWDYLRKRDKRLWHKIRWSFIGWWCNLRSPLGVRAFKWGYRTVRDIFKFN